MSLKVLHVISGLKVGGAEQAMLRLITESRTRGIQHLVVALSPGGGMVERYERAGVDLHFLDLRRKPIKSLLQLMDLMIDRPPDIVQTWMYHADVLGGLLAKLIRCRAILWGIRTTELPEDASLSTRALRRLGAWMSPWVPDHIVCVAAASRDSHLAMGYSPHRISVIPNGYDLKSMEAEPSARDRLRAEWGLKPNAVVIGTVGRLSLEKGQDLFVKAAGQVAAQCPTTRFLMVGRGNDPYSTALYQGIEASGYADRFILVGERSDVANCLSAMDIFCLPSRSEGFPNVLVEAMVARVPCVTTDAGDARQVVGSLFPVIPRNDQEALTSALLDLVDRLPEYVDAVNRARRRVEDHFSIKRVVDQYHHLYYQILNRQEP